jgi:hypothetical protein
MLQVAMQHSPGKSSRKAVSKLGISQQSAQLIAKYDFNMFSYKMPMLHKLSERNKQRQLQFATWTEMESAT